MARIVFAGTPEFAAIPLKALIEAGHEIVAVYSQLDRPAGRGRKLTASPVKQVALEHDIPVCQPLNFKSEEARAELDAWQADLMIVIAYGLILPQVVLDMPRLGCVNLHASLLPRWRGAGPIQRAIEAGDTETGLCLMQMEAGLDTGPVLASVSCPIGSETTAASLHDELADLGAEKLPQWIHQLLAGEFSPQVQDDSASTYAHKLSKAEALIDWTQDAQMIDRRVRAFDPWPGSQARLGDDLVKLFGVSVEEAQTGQAGEILAADERGLRVACGQGVLNFREIQFPGSRRMPVEAAARGRPLQGLRFDLAE